MLFCEFRTIFIFLTRFEKVNKDRSKMTTPPLSLSWLKWVELLLTVDEGGNYFFWHIINHTSQSHLTFDSSHLSQKIPRGGACHTDMLRHWSEFDWQLEFDWQRAFSRFFPTHKYVFFYVIRMRVYFYHVFRCARVWACARMRVRVRTKHLQVQINEL